jgi:hypothetical protein
MKMLAMLTGAVALAASGVPALLVVAGRLDLATAKSVMTAGVGLWFVGLPVLGRIGRRSTGR